MNISASKIQQQGDTMKMTAGGTRMGMVRCEHCNRQFNQHSAARHIPWCAKHQSEARRNKMSPEKREALERFKWRINYKPTNKIATTHSSSNYHQRSLRQQTQNSNSLNSNISTASSSNSARTSSIENSSGDFNLASGKNKRYNLNKASVHSNNFAQNQNQNQKQNQQLTRSVSSTTLTKQKGSMAIPVITNAESPSPLGRAKSSGDLLMSGRDIIVMSEVMELLTKRMDEIYEQNERLLQSLRITQQQHQNINTNEDSISNSNTILISSADDAIVCSYCKTRSPPHSEANFCHKCGRKLPNETDQDERSPSRSTVSS